MQNEFYGFDGRMNCPITGDQPAGKNEPPANEKRELFEAMKMIAEKGRGPAEQLASIGCSIKWKDD